MSYVNCRARELQSLVLKDGKRVVEPKKLDDIREYVKSQLESEIWQEEQRFENPHKHYLDMSPEYYKMRINMEREFMQLK